MLTQEDVENLLRSWECGFEALNHVEGRLRYTSLREPRDRGIYYVVGGASLPASVIGSLVLCDALPSDVTPGNAYLVLDNPQLAYYKLMKTSYPPRGDSGRHPTAIVDPEASVAPDAYIGPFCIIESGARIGRACRLDSHVVIKSGSVIDNGTQIDSHCVIGAAGVAWVWDEDCVERVVQPQTGGVRVGKSVFIATGVSVVRGSINEVTEIGDGTVIAPGSKIGHGCRIGRYSHLANNVTLAGNVHLGERVFVGSAAVARPQVRIADGVVVGAGAVVVADQIEPNCVIAGTPARVIKRKPGTLSGVPATRARYSSGDGAHDLETSKTRE